MKRKVIIHPLFWFIFTPLFVLFGGGTLMLHLDRIYKLPNPVNVAIGLSLGLFAIIWLILFPKSLTKVLKKSEKLKIQDIKKNAFSNKSFTLIQERNILANLALILGCVSIYIAWLIFLPVKEFFSLGFWIFRIISILLTIFGVIFSFLTPKKLLTYKNGKLFISTKEKNIDIMPSELLSCKTITSSTFSKNDPRATLFGNVVLLLKNGEEIILKKPDKDIFLSKIIKIIKEVELKTENKQI